MIARLDDACELKKMNLKPNSRYPDLLLARLNWSKNVREERDAPNRILIGAMDPDYCVLLGLGLHLETSISQVSSESPYVFNFGTANPQNANTFVSNTLRNKIILGEDFKALFDGPLGTHSTRKYSTTEAHKNGGALDDVDYHGRWKKHK